MPNYYPYPNYFQQIQPQPQYIQPKVEQPQIQNGGFVSVRSEDEARNYPVAQGMSVTFKDETAPYIYTKTMGFSQLDRPLFDKYKLVKENPVEHPIEPQIEPQKIETDNSELEGIKGEIKALWKEIENIKEAPAKKTSRKKEEEGD